MIITLSQYEENSKNLMLFSIKSILNNPDENRTKAVLNLNCTMLKKFDFSINQKENEIKVD
jgi:hypothetical protein